jgi:hypothetical protein
VAVTGELLAEATLLWSIDPWYPVLGGAGLEEGANMAQKEINTADRPVRTLVT